MSNIPLPPPSRSTGDRRRSNGLRWLAVAAVVLVVAALIPLLIVVAGDDSDAETATTAATAAPATTDVPTSSTTPPPSSDEPTNGATCPTYSSRDDIPVSLCDKGHVVSLAQEALTTWGATITVDEHFGPATEAAVRSFQSDHGLENDGIVGPYTWAALVPYLGDVLICPDGDPVDEDYVDPDYCRQDGGVLTEPDGDPVDDVLTEPDGG
jgi:hypothetical protein